MELCELLIEKNLGIRLMCDTRVDLLHEEMLTHMKRAGCCRVNMGVESGSPEILRSINKGICIDQIRSIFTMIRRAGDIHVCAYFIMGFPGKRAEQVRESMELMEELKPDDAMWSLHTPYPGTEI
jgi:anaerobic magnesium-protoporphyrin IX monomethyl ester cyclase